MRSITTQDPVRVIRKYVDDELDRAGETYIAGTIAARVVDRLAEDDPALLLQFLQAHAVQIITRMIGEITRSQRSYTRAVADRRLFSGAVERYQQGDENALSAWLDVMYVVNTDQQRKRLRDMDRDELRWAAEDYNARAKGNLLQSAFLKALATKVGAKTVGEVYTEEELTRMWGSIHS